MPKSDPHSWKKYGHQTKFHIVVQGQCWLQVEGWKQAIALSAGDLILLSNAPTHAFRDTLTSPVVSVEHLQKPPLANGFKAVQYGGASPEIYSVIVSSGMQFCEAIHNPLLAALPLLIHIPGKAGRLMPWLRTNLESLECEVVADLPGRQTVLTRLAEILFVQAVRVYLSQLPEQQGGWLRALIEPGISTALGFMHRHPEQPWTVAALAQHASMSRSSFAARFTQLVGVPPLKYLTQRRMAIASTLLQEEHWTLQEIALRVGYDSEVAFSQAFKR
ncbi:MAG: AraC family transcriptional regulator [Lyngbya sp. HA4199-MV5]|nr:AraC family transcriptional regulator [Lyngbya sp. HA4199-MV5]